MKKYIIVSGPSPADLALQVESALNQGWELAGGVAFSLVNRALYMQAMTKTE